MSHDLSPPFTNKRGGLGESSALLGVRRRTDGITHEGGKWEGMKEIRREKRERGQRSRERESVVIRAVTRMLPTRGERRAERERLFLLGGEREREEAVGERPPSQTAKRKLAPPPEHGEERKRPLGASHLSCYIPSFYPAKKAGEEASENFGLSSSSVLSYLPQRRKKKKKKRRGNKAQQVTAAEEKA
jgi:hypothetical protein